jgi:hypothetical protein
MVGIGQVAHAMIAYFGSDVRRINHFLKVYGFAKAIGEAEELDQRTQEILEIAALTHDIGIKNSEVKFGSSAGPYQESEGPPEAKRLLEGLGVDPAVTGRVCWLIAHHHSYNTIIEIDHQILVEADFLVNAFEESLFPAAIRNLSEKLFRTKTGTELLRSLYSLPV